MAKSKEVLVVGSKVKALIKSKKCLTAGDLLPALSEKVAELLDAAATRCKSNKRSTGRANDL